MRTLSTASVLLRLVLAMLFGGVIGLERGRKGRAAGLWASACTGLATGAGVYERVLLALLLISLVTRVLPQVEN